MLKFASRLQLVCSVWMVQKANSSKLNKKIASKHFAIFDLVQCYVISILVWHVVSFFLLNSYFVVLIFFFVLFRANISASWWFLLFSILFVDLLLCSSIQIVCVTWLYNSLFFFFYFSFHSICSATNAPNYQTEWLRCVELAYLKIWCWRFVFEFMWPQFECGEMSKLHSNAQYVCLSPLLCPI